MSELRAMDYHSDGYQRLEKQLGGRPSDGAAPIVVGDVFMGQPDAKSFALQQLAQLESSIETYNVAVRDWTPEKAQAFREKTWTTGYEAYKRNHAGASEAEAIAFADKGLKTWLLREGKVDDGNIRSALGPLERTFGLTPWSLIRENEDGTLSLNPMTLTFGGSTVLEIGSPLGQSVDQAA